MHVSTQPLGSGSAEVLTCVFNSILKLAAVTDKPAPRKQSRSVLAQLILQNDPEACSLYLVLFSTTVQQCVL